MDTNQVITEAVENNEEAIETAAEAIAEAGWTGTDVAGAFALGALIGVCAFEGILKPLCYRAIDVLKAHRKPKVVEVKAEGKPAVEETTETKEPETQPSEEKPEEK